MSGAAIVRALLAANPAITVVITDPQKIRAGILPQGVVPPAISVHTISENEQRTMARNLPVKMIRERVQVTVLAKTYVSMKQLMKAAALGQGVHTGVILGIKVCDIEQYGVGPEIPPADDGIYEQSRDFMVTFVEAN